jgi:hypothetical protein
LNSSFIIVQSSLHDPRTDRKAERPPTLGVGDRLIDEPDDEVKFTLDDKPMRGSTPKHASAENHTKTDGHKRHLTPPDDDGKPAALASRPFPVA